MWFVDCSYIHTYTHTYTHIYGIVCNGKAEAVIIIIIFFFLGGGGGGGGGGVGSVLDQSSVNLNQFSSIQ